MDKFLSFSTIYLVKNGIKLKKVNIGIEKCVFALTKLKKNTTQKLNRK
jgi:hypothetical protein